MSSLVCYGPKAEVFVLNDVFYRFECHVRWMIVMKMVLLHNMYGELVYANGFVVLVLLSSPIVYLCGGVFHLVLELFHGIIPTKIGMN